MTDNLAILRNEEVQALAQAELCRVEAMLLGRGDRNCEILRECIDDLFRRATGKLLGTFTKNIMQENRNGRSREAD